MGVDIVRMCGRRIGAHPCDILGIRCQDPRQEQARAHFRTAIKAATVGTDVVGRDTDQEGGDTAARCRGGCGA